MTREIANDEAMFEAEENEYTDISDAEESGARSSKLGTSEKKTNQAVEGPRHTSEGKGTTTGTGVGEGEAQNTAAFQTLSSQIDFLY